MGDDVIKAQDPATPEGTPPATPAPEGDSPAGQM